MRIILNKTTADNKEFWSFVEQKSREIQNWPAWMRLESQAKPGRGPRPIKVKKETDPKAPRD